MSTSLAGTAEPSPPALEEVTGPSALGGGRRRFLDLLWLIAVTEFKRTYFGTVLGYLWSLIRPLTMFGVLLFVFTQVFKVGSNLDDYPVLLLLGIVQFTFFQEATSSAVASVVVQEGVVRKTQFPRLVIPLATVLTAFFNFLLNLVIVVVFILAWGVDPKLTWLLFPFATAALRCGRVAEMRHDGMAFTAPMTTVTIVSHPLGGLLEHEWGHRVFYDGEDIGLDGLEFVAADNGACATEARSGGALVWRID